MRPAFQPSQPPFRLRALTLAIAAFGIGALCFISAVKGCSKTPAKAPVTSAPQAWPSGYVVLEDASNAPPVGHAPSAAPSASSPAPGR